MKKTIIITLMMIGIAISILGCVGAKPSSGSKFTSRYADEMPPSETSNKPSKADIWVEGNRMYYNGDIGVVEYELFEYVLDTYASEPIKTLIINSHGGDTVLGRKIGSYVFDNQIDVEVDKLCVSSCANYIFTAGKNKTIRKDSFVVWHGSEQQLIYQAEFDNTSPYESATATIEELLTTIPALYRKQLPENFVEEQVAVRITALSEEAAFFEKIGVNIHLTLVGLLEYEGVRDIFPAYKANDNMEGWTYSIEDMELFGVDNVTYLGDASSLGYPSGTVLVTGRAVFKAEIGDYDMNRVFDYSPESMGQ